MTSSLFRSSRPDYIETRTVGLSRSPVTPLFRSSRPDYIETIMLYEPLELLCVTVPVFQTGLH